MRTPPLLSLVGRLQFFKLLLLLLWLLVVLVGERQGCSWGRAGTNRGMVSLIAQLRWRPFREAAGRAGSSWAWLFYNYSNSKSLVTRLCSHFTP